MSKSFCRKCLLEEMDEELYFKNITEYVNRIDEDLKVCNEVYEERLSICKECDDLINGMCRKCGCFVQVRAAVKNNYCPGEKKSWNKVL